MSIIVCGSLWGVGVTVDNDGQLISYGFPVTENPNNFIPDHECCSDEEMSAHKKACEEYKS